MAPDVKSDSPIEIQEDTEEIATDSTVSRLRSALRNSIHRPEAGALIGAVAIYLIFFIFGSSNFSSAGGFAAWLNIAAELGIIALPVGLVMIAGELDLSVGSVLAASSMTVAIIGGYYGLPKLVAIACGLAFGLLIGFVNGFLVTKTRLPSFVVTLATLFGLQGVTLGLSRKLTGTTSVALPGCVPPAGTTQCEPDIFKHIFGTFVGGKFSVAIFWWIGVILIVVWVLHVSPWGNWILAVGGDEVGARASGIPTQRVKIALFMGSALGASLVGAIQSNLYNSAQVANGQSFVFNSIIAVVIGGVLLLGGYGSVVGVVLGTVTFSIVKQGIYYTGWEPDWSATFLGVLVLVAVLLNNTFRRLALTRAPQKKGKKT